MMTNFYDELINQINIVNCLENECKKRVQGSRFKVQGLGFGSEDLKAALDVSHLNPSFQP
jgi:hypothetical protein